MVGLLDGQSRRENTSHCRGIKITLGSSIAKPLDLRNVGGGELGGNPWSWLSASQTFDVLCKNPVDCVKAVEPSRHSVPPPPPKPGLAELS